MVWYLSCKTFILFYHRTKCTVWNLLFLLNQCANYYTTSIVPIHRTSPCLSCYYRNDKIFEGLLIWYPPPEFSKWHSVKSTWLVRCPRANYELVWLGWLSCGKQNDNNNNNKSSAKCCQDSQEQKDVLSCRGENLDAISEQDRLARGGGHFFPLIPPCFCGFSDGWWGVRSRGRGALTPESNCCHYVQVRRIMRRPC